jgi:hypothetical protein
VKELSSKIREKGGREIYNPTEILIFLANIGFKISSENFWTFDTEHVA